MRHNYFNCVNMFCHVCHCAINEMCACSCHHVTTYTASDIINAQFEADEANESLKIKNFEQADERKLIANKLKQLNEDIEPFREKYNQAQIKLLDIKNRLLGPWEDDNYTGSNIYLLNKEHAWYNNRVWLRTVFRDEREPKYQWEVRIEKLKAAELSRDIVLGPPSSTISRKDELQIMKRTAEIYIARMGYILHHAG